MAGIPTRPRATRRTVLAALGLAPLALATACTGSTPDDVDPSGATPSPTGPSTDPDAAVLETAAAGERDLVAAYDAAMAAFPELTISLALLREQHLAHAAALGPGPSPSASGSTAPAPAAPPTSATAALEGLLAAERAAADARTQECGQASGLEAARLLALIAASESSHVEALARAAAP